MSNDITRPTLLLSNRIGQYTCENAIVDSHSEERGYTFNHHIGSKKNNCGRTATHAVVVRPLRPPFIDVYVSSNLCNECAEKHAAYYRKTGQDNSDLDLYNVEPYTS